MDDILTKKNRETRKPTKKIPDVNDVLNNVNIAGKHAFLV